jgi:uncharacterized protein
MNIRKIAEKNKILEIKTGSHLYGLDTPESDLDYGGIFLPSKELIFGLSKYNEVDLSLKDKLKNGKNSKDAVDRKLYEFRKYIELALQNNPNILEMIFVNEENIVFVNDFGRKLLDMSHLFPHKGLKNRFIGYAISQKKKMVVKRDNYLELEKAEDILEKICNDGNGKLLLPQCETIYNEFKEAFKIKKQTDSHYRVADRSLVKNQTAKRALQEIRQIIGYSTNRKDLIKSKGFDTKFGSHLIRLLIEGKELLETGRLEFPIKRREEVMNIKTGKWSLSEVLDYSEHLENEINKSLIKSTLPNKPNYKEIENFTMEMLEEWILRDIKR